MKTPTLEEIKEYFKNAKEVKDRYDDTIFELSEIIEGHCKNTYMDKNSLNTVWSKSRGYAEIISYKDTKPQHYPQGYDVIDFVKDNELNFNEGNVIKYVVRARKKGSHIEDLKKAKDYLEREIKHYETIPTTKN